MEAIRTVKAESSISSLCPALGLSRAAFYRMQGPSPNAPKNPPSTPRKPHPSALSPEEQDQALKVLNQEKFMDKPPHQVHAALLDSGIYICSVGTMYRLLKAHHQLRERRNLTSHPVYQKPELLATAPNQLWSWDITKLLGPAKWTYFYLYVILDVFSRYVVGWMVAPRESADLAKDLIGQTYDKQGIVPNQLTIHADRGSSMKSKPVAFLLADLGVTKTHSRPSVSNDNPFSESQFKTLKYRPEFPSRFGSMEDARAFCQNFFPWYNREHYHSGIAYLTPETVHHGRASDCLEKREKVLEMAFRDHPERFPRGRSIPNPLPKAVWINPPENSTKGGQQ
jgi:putative transposase